jgi:hypothetical protein
MVVFVALLLQINCIDYRPTERVWLFNILIKFLMLAAVEISHLLMPAALTLLYYMPITCKACILEGKIRNHQYIG